MTSTSDDRKRQLLRHTLATLAYRGGKAVRNAPASFAAFRAGDTSRSPGEILAHIGDLLDWALSLARGAQAWQDSASLPWGAPPSSWARCSMSTSCCRSASGARPSGG